MVSTKIPTILHFCIFFVIFIAQFGLHFCAMQHKGELVEKAVRESGFSITKLATRLGKSRRWVYDAFENRNLSIDVILEIGKVIYYDFSNDIEELKRFKINAQDSAQFAYQVDQTSAEFWKNKYLDLLEKYNRLLEGE